MLRILATKLINHTAPVSLYDSTWSNPVIVYS